MGKVEREVIGVDNKTKVLIWENYIGFGNQKYLLDVHCNLYNCTCLSVYCENMLRNIGIKTVFDAVIFKNIETKLDKDVFDELKEALDVYGLYLEMEEYELQNYVKMVKAIVGNRYSKEKNILKYIVVKIRGMISGEY